MASINDYLCPRMKKLKIPRYIQWITLCGLVFLILMSLLRYLLVACFAAPADEQVSLAKAYVLGVRFDLRIVCIFMLTLFLVGTVPALHPINKKWGRRVALWLCLLFIIFFCVLYAVDFGNYAYLHERLNASLLNYLQDARISFTMMWQTYHLGWNTLALIAVIVLLLWVLKLLYNFILGRQVYATKASRITWSIVFVLLMAWGIVGRLVVRAGEFPLRWSDAFSLKNDYAANIALNPFQSFFSTLTFRHSTYDAAKVKEHYPLMAAYLGVDQPDADKLNFLRVVAGDPTAPKYNVVLVICESFSMYKSSMVGNRLNTTPYFNSLCQNGVFFNRCFTPTIGTARGVWATLTGIPDVELKNTSSRNPAAVDQHTIINDFAGYERFYFLGGSTSWANIRGVLTNNIDSLHIYEEGSYDAGVVDVWGISDKNLFLEANKVLARQQKPFFAVIQTADNHRPYTIPAEDEHVFKKVNAPADSLHAYGFESNDELNAFRYTDFSFQTFIEAAKKQPYFNNTIFVFVGDHGIAGDAGNMLPRGFSTSSLVATHVPLLFYAPGILQPALKTHVCSQVDVLPTIAGINKIGYTNKTMGRDLLRLDSLKLPYLAPYISIGSGKIGMLNNEHFYGYLLTNNKARDLVSLTTNDAVKMSDSLQKRYQSITEALYETARYMLLNNKKKTYAPAP
jgi:phosphoglycerol transferase MdoB-like AlkP superfamily enzyme